MTQISRLMFGLLALLIVESPAAQTTYPEKPIRFVLPFPPGGGTGTLASAIGQKLGDNVGQTIVLDHRPGAGANLGPEIAARAVPDGYTLLMTNITHSINVTLYRKLSYDLIKDFSPVTRLASIPNILVVHPSVAVKTVNDRCERFPARNQHPRAVCSTHQVGGRQVGQGGQGGQPQSRVTSDSEMGEGDQGVGHQAGLVPSSARDRAYQKLQFERKRPANTVLTRCG